MPQRGLTISPDGGTFTLAGSKLRDTLAWLEVDASGVPEETLRGIAEQSDYETSLRSIIFGQDHAVREVACELGLIKAGMTDPNKPASVMLFLGQTGTGKTEMAKALARFYSASKRLRTYTLGNCVEPHSVSTIIGVPLIDPTAIASPPVANATVNANIALLVTLTRIQDQQFVRALETRL